MIEYLSIVAIVLVLVLAYYVKDSVDKITSHFFDVKKDVQSSMEKVEHIKQELAPQIALLQREVEHLKEKEVGEPEKYESWKIKNLEQKISKLEKLLKEQAAHENTRERELNFIKNEINRLKSEIHKTQEFLQREFNKLKNEVKSTLIKDIEEEIELLEERIEQRKEQELQEFMDILSFSVNLEPEKVQRGLLDLKKGLLSLRDIAKVYVLTGKGQEEFYKLRDNIIELLKNLRKLAIVSHPEEKIYNQFRDIILELKHLDLPMKIEKNGRIKELNPEKSFIEIHHRIYSMIGRVDRIAETLDTPLPVTPIEKEFYEKLKIQFEELKQLEMQLENLMSRLGQKIEPEDPTIKSKKELETLLKELEL